MTDFENKQSTLQISRNEMEIARQKLYQKEELLKLQQLKIKQRLELERISFLSDTDSDQKLLVKLQDQVYDLQLEYEAAQFSSSKAENDFNALGNHTEMVGKLEDHFPILMMPVQVQTRFVNVKHLATNVSQSSILDASSIAINPVSLLSFQEKYFEENLFNVSTYSSLKAEHGYLTYYNRALDISYNDKIKGKKWLKSVPDSKELLVRIYPDDIFVHTHESHLTPEEQMDGEAFWKKWWNIHSENKNALKEEHQEADLLGKPLFTAWNILHRKYQHTRAAWIFRATMPANYSPNNVVDYKNTTPDFSKNKLKIKSEDWTTPILSWVMPDKFVVTLTQGDTTQHFEGAKIPFPLKLSPTPKEGADLDEIKWVKDFEEAEKIGMAIRISLDKNGFNPQANFEKLIVAGVKASVKAEDEMEQVDGKKMLEDLLENHRYKGTGMSILPQGTPTNNFESVSSGYTEDGLPEQEVFKLETGQPLFGNQTKWKTKKDGQYLVKALGIDAGIFQHTHRSDSKDIAHAFAINRLLWSGTMGYYLKQFFQPLISLDDIEKTRNFFFDHVSARGFLPVFRVNEQPYGILPMANFSKWTFQENEDDFEFFTNFHKKILKPLDAIWKEFSLKIKNISDPSLNLEQGQFSEEFLRILGLSASSKSFFQRPQIGNYVIENSVAANFKTKPKKSGNSIFGLNPGPNNPTQYVNYIMKKVASAEYRNGFIINELKNLGIDLPYITYGGEFILNSERIFKMHFSKLYKELPNQLIEKLEPSERRALSDLEGQDINYLEWLKKASHLELLESFPKEIKDKNKPDALFYLLARQAMARNYLEVAAQIAPQEAKINGEMHPQRKNISTIDFELEHLFDHSFFEIYQGETVQKFGGEVETFLKKIIASSIDSHPNNYLYKKNKWDYLQQSLTENSNETIGHFLDNLKLSNTSKAYFSLTEAKRALDCLENETTAKLERLFSEHLDLCSHRLDAWMLGLVNRRLTQLREKANTGIYLGAYGYVENLSFKDENKSVVYKIVDNPVLEEAKSKNKLKQGKLVLPFIDFKSFAEKNIDVNELLENSFIYLGKQASGRIERSEKNFDEIISAPYFDAANEGFIHTPSPAHATTAAILRSGFLANNPSKTYDEFAVNLSSQRVRKALYYIEGMQNGQELAALLGYQFERDLHENPIPDLDKYIYYFRQIFPLGKKNEPTNDATEEQKPFNVVHGIDLINAFRKTENTQQDFFQNKTTIDNIEDQNQIIAAIKKLSEQMDAISDLLLSESIFHTAKGDRNRSGAVLKMLSNDKKIDIPEITKTPKSGKPLAHILGVQFDLKSTEKIWAGVETPRSRLNPGLNRWLYEQLPNPRLMCFNVEVNGEIKKLKIRNLLLQPIDFIALFQEENPLSETSALTFLIKEVAVKFFKPPLDIPIRVLYFDKKGITKTQFTLGELKPLFENLLKIIKDSRPMFPTDLQLSSKARPLEKESYEKIDNTDFLTTFEEIVEGKDNGFLYRNYINIQSFTKYYKKSIREKFPNKNEQTTYTRLLELLHAPIFYAPLIEDYNLPFGHQKENENLIVEKGERAVEHHKRIYKAANALWKRVKKMEDKKQQWEGLVELGKLIFGNSLTLFPKFRLNNLEEFKAAKSFPDLMDDVDDEARIEWLQGVALVREKTKEYKKLETYRNLFKLKSKDEKLEILQLPYQNNADNYRWLGSDFSPRIKINGEQLSIALEFPAGYQVANLQSGMIIDFWTERIQSEATETAFAIHYNQPNAEPPQSCLLCVPSEITGNWSWDDLVGCVESAIDMAKKRAVEPEQLAMDFSRIGGKYSMDGHPLRFMLPALSIPVSNSKETAALGFDGDNNHF